MHDGQWGRACRPPGSTTGVVITQKHIDSKEVVVSMTLYEAE